MTWRTALFVVVIVVLSIAAYVFLVVDTKEEPPVVIEMESTEEGVFCLYQGHRWQARVVIAEHMGKWVCSSKEMVTS